MNIDRMRRYIARNTPDEISRKFDLMSDEYNKQYYAWVKKFTDRMVVKHGGNVRVDVYVNQEYAMRTHESLIILRVVEKKPWQEEQAKLRLDLESLPHAFVERQMKRRATVINTDPIYIDERPFRFYPRKE